MNFFFKLPIQGIYLKISTSNFWVHSHFSQATFGLHLVKYPKASKICTFEKLDHGSVAMEECALTWDNFMVHDVNNPLLLHLHHTHLLTL